MMAILQVKATRKRRPKAALSRELTKAEDG